MLYHNIIPILECVYIVYMFNFFETSYGFHHPCEMQTKYTWLQHPLYESTTHENRICKMGSMWSYLAAIYIISTTYFYPNDMYCNTICWTLVYVVAFVLNFNAFVYLTPVYIYEMASYRSVNYTGTSGDMKNLEMTEGLRS
jgi:hypothetical protein